MRGCCVLRVLCTVPGGGLLELSGHFEIQKVMYGFCSVKEPQAVLPKYVLVNWVSGAMWGHLLLSPGSCAGAIAERHKRATGGAGCQRGGGGTQTAPGSAHPWLM